MNVLVIAASTEKNIEYIKEIYNSEEIKVVICADGGIEKAKKLNIPVDIHMGDFDSSAKDSTLNEIEFQREKDWSDTEASLEKAIDMGGKKIFLVGATGGRMDHHFANVYSIFNERFKDVDILICDNQNIITKAKSCKIKKNPKFKYLGVIPVDEVLENVTLKGVKYPVEKINFYRHKSLGISNEIQDQYCQMEIGKGNGFLILSKDK